MLQQQNAILLRPYPKQSSNLARLLVLDWDLDVALRFEFLAMEAEMLVGWRRKRLMYTLAGRRGQKQEDELIKEVLCWMVTGERQSACIRSLYLNTILGQDVAFFDTETTTGEVVGRLTSGTILIQEAMGEKVGKFIQLASASFGGFLIAFIKGWLLTMVRLSCIPLVIICGGLMAMTMSKMSSRGQIAYEEAGNLVEQTIGVIRTVASFTGEKHAIEKYNAGLKVAYIAAVHQGLASGVGVGIMLLVLFGTYGLAVWYGYKLIMEKSYNGGQVITIILSVMYGGISLGQISPSLNAFAAGQAAAYKMYETIVVKPRIGAYDYSGMVLDDVHGKLNSEMYISDTLPDLKSKSLDFRCKFQAAKLQL